MADDFLQLLDLELYEVGRARPRNRNEVVRTTDETRRPEVRAEAGFAQSVKVAVTALEFSLAPRHQVRRDPRAAAVDDAARAIPAAARQDVAESQRA